MEALAEIQRGPWMVLSTEELLNKCAWTGILASIAPFNAEGQGAVQLEDFSNIFANSLKSHVMFNTLKSLVNP